MSTLPLSHHEIVGLIEPFTRCGRRVDLAASNRLERRLVFKPVDHAIAARDDFVLTESLQLEKLETGTFRLTRTLNSPGWPSATLVALGSDPAQMLPHFQAIDPLRHFCGGAGYRITRSYELEQDWRLVDGCRPEPTLIFTRGTASLEGLRLELSLPSTRGVAAEITLETAPAGVDWLEFPDDLLAVLGWDWVALRRIPGGWRTKVRLRGDKQRRSRAAEAALEAAAAHVAATLSEPPGRFSQRWRLARWGVVLRRSIPVLTVLVLIGTIAVLPRFGFDRSPRTWTLLFHVPTLLIALSFCLQENAQYEIPPLPKALKASAWRRPESR